MDTEGKFPIKEEAEVSEVVLLLFEGSVACERGMAQIAGWEVFYWGVDPHEVKQFILVIFHNNAHASEAGLNLVLVRISQRLGVVSYSLEFVPKDFQMRHHKHAVVHKEDIILLRVQQAHSFQWK